MRLMPLTILSFLLLTSTISTQENEVMPQGATTLRTGPVTTKDKVEFRLNLPTLEQAMAMPVRLRVDNSAQSAAYSTLVPPRKCDRRNRQYYCENFLPSAIVTRLNVPGKHLLYSYTFDGNCCESAPSTPWTLTTPQPK